MTVEWFLAGVLVGAVGVWLQQHDRESSDAVDEYLEHREADLRDRYETTAMDYVEFGDRVAVLEAPGTERIMRDAIAVDGVGPDTAFAIARRFGGDYEAYRTADREQLESINGVGENRATALLTA